MNLNQNVYSVAYSTTM